MTNRQIKFRTPMKCQNSHFRWWFRELYRSECKVYWGDKNCSCPVDGIDNGFEPIGDDEQFTGLLDKNGKEIYEGDIVVLNAWPWSKVLGKIKLKFVEWSSQTGFAPFNEFCENPEIMGYPPAGDWCEIIGNLYEDPDLIK